MGGKQNLRGTLLRKMPTLRELREEQFLTQEELHVEAGVGRTTIIRIEAGQPGRFRPSTIKKLAKALKVKPQEIDLPPKA